MAKKLVRPDLVDKCPNCGVDFQKPPLRRKEDEYKWVDNKNRKSWQFWKRKRVWRSIGKKWHTYSQTPVMQTSSGLACMNCGIHEGKEVIQEGYSDRGFFKNTHVPPVHGDKIWKLRK